MKRKSLYLPVIFASILLLGNFVSFSAVAGEFAQIGVVHDNGTVELFRERIKKDMGDGFTASEISTKFVDGNLMLVRKGYNNSNCQKDMLRIANHNGPIGAANPVVAGDILHVLTGIYVIKLECQDNTCSDHVTAVGNPPRAVRARCEDPENFTSPCPCRFPEAAGGEIVTVINACEKKLTWVLLLELGGWINAQYIQYN